MEEASLGMVSGGVATSCEMTLDPPEVNKKPRNKVRKMLLTEVVTGDGFVGLSVVAESSSVDTLRKAAVADGTYYSVTVNEKFDVKTSTVTVVKRKSLR